MPRILVASGAGVEPGHRTCQWITVGSADDIIEKITAMQQSSSFFRELEPSGADPKWSVLAYEGLPDFGPHPDLDDLLAYLDAVDDYGEPFEKLWSSRRFESVIQATDVFADTYQGTYSNAGAWSRHYLSLMGDLGRAGPEFDFDAYARAAAAKGDVRFIAANDGGVHVFWDY
jgi:hypothetical protein